MQLVHVATGRGPRVPGATGGRHRPLPSYNGPPGELGKKAMHAASRESETAGGHGRPPSHSQTLHSTQSLIDAAPAHLTELVQHHVVAATRSRGSSLSPCAEPSIPDSGSADVLTTGCPRTPVSAGRVVVHHIPERSQIYQSPNHKTLCETDNPDYPDISVELPLTGVNPDKYRTGLRATNQGRALAPDVYPIRPRVHTLLPNRTAGSCRNLISRRRSLRWWTNRCLAWEHQGPLQRRNRWSCRSTRRTAHRPRWWPPIIVSRPRDFPM